MAGLLYDTKNVVKGMAMLYVAAASDTLTYPSDDTPLFSPENAGWGADWRAAGATEEGYKFVVETETEPTNIEEQSTPVSIDLQSRDVRIEAALAEDSLETMKLAYGAGVITVTAATATTPGTKTLTFSDDIDRMAAVLEMKNRYGLARRIIIPEFMAGGSVDTEFRRAAGKRLYAATFTATCQTSEIRVVEVTAPKTEA